MNVFFSNLSASQKKAIAGLACMVSAQAHKGKFRTNSPEADIIVQQCFPSSWTGFWDTDYRHLYLTEAATSDMNMSLDIVSGLDTDVKYAVKNLLIEVMGDDAISMLTASHIVQQIGLPANSFPEPKKSPRVEKNTHEDDGTITFHAEYARLADVNAVRETDKVYTLKKDNEDQGVKVGANYDAWKSLGVCPTNGVVGYIDPHKTIDTPEGALRLLVCTDNLIIPVLDWGLEKLDEWEAREKSQNNTILALDKSGKRCEALRAMKKRHSPKSPGQTANSDKTIVHFMATIQERFEPGKYYPPYYIQRQIHLTYTKRGSHLELEVIGVMRPRQAKFEKDDGRILTYRDTTNPYVYYEVETWPADNSVVRVSVFQPNASRDYIEYRYTVENYG